MGHPNYEVTEGSITLDGVDLLALEPDERAKAGLFLAFQYPTAIPGVSVANFLRHAVTNVRNPDRKEGEDLIPMRDFRKELREQMDELGVDQEFARRYLNDGFSGGEKKRAEILQLAMLRPAFAILDETDSGLDIDAVRIVSEGVNRVAARHETGVLVITHYERILNYIKPQFVHILFGGRIVENGGPELVKLLEKEGYDWVREKYPDAAKDEDEMEAAQPAKTAPGHRLRTSQADDPRLVVPNQTQRQQEGTGTDVDRSEPPGCGNQGRLQVRVSRLGRELLVQERQGIDARDRLPDLGDEERAAVDARHPPEGARGLPVRSRRRCGAAICRSSTSTTSTTT